MKISYNPITAEALTTAPDNNDITFDLSGLNIFVKGVRFRGTDTTYKVFKKYNSSNEEGYDGLVPAPSYSPINLRYLREDGTWQVPQSYILLENVDLDTLKIEGMWYYSPSNSSNTNCPDGFNDGAELYIGKNSDNHNYQKVILYDGTVWFRIFDGENWNVWTRQYTTDENVSQILDATENFRPVVLGYTNSNDTSQFSNVTQKVYTTTSIYTQPSTGSLWANMLYSQGKPVLVEHQSLQNYVTLNTAQTITGQKTFTSQINSTLNTATYLEGNRGKTIINSTAGAGSYVMLFKGNSTDGYFTHGIYQNKYLLQYTAKSTVDVGTNAVTKSVTLLDESGNSQFPGSVIAPKFIGPLQGNADSATKLQTARTIWGRPFDGTANVSGNLDNVGNLNAASNNSYLARNASDQSSGIPWHGIGIMQNENFFGNRGAAFVSGYFGVLLRAGGVSLKLDYDSKSIISSTKIRATGGFVKEGSSNSYVLLGGGGHKELSTIQSEYDSRYVNITGDTMVGPLRINWNGSDSRYSILDGSGLKFYPPSGGWSREMLQYDSTGNNILAAFGFYGGGNTLNYAFIGTGYNSPWLKINGSLFTYNNNKIWHAGNDGSGSGLDADTVDSYHSSRLFTQNERITGYNIDTIDLFGSLDIQPSSENNISGNKPFDSWGTLLMFKSIQGASRLQLAFRGMSEPYIRCSYGTSSSITVDWKRLAFTTSNVASASQVKVSQHTTNNTNYPLVWSNQPNTNTGNSDLFKSWNHLYYNPAARRLTVSGGITSLGTIRIKCTTSNYQEGITIQNADSQWCTIRLGSTADAGTSDNTWSIHRTNNNNFSISRNSSNGANGLSINKSGSVGLGYADNAIPGYKLAINGTLYTADKHYYLFNGDSTLRIYGETSGINEGINLQVGIDARFDDYAISTYGGESRHPLILNPRGGYVGIGVRPSQKLHVNGNSYTTGYFSGNTLIARVATGTAPLTVTSTTLVNNLNVDLLDGLHANNLLYSFNDSDFDPNTYDGYYVGMTTKSGISTDWWHILSMSWCKGNTGGNKTWTSQLALPTQGRTGIRYRSGNGASSYHGWIQVWDSGNFNPGNYMRAVNANGYYGMARPDGNTSDWIRTTSSGIIPYQRGGSTAGHCSIGTSSWYFSSAYIQNMYGTLHGEASSSKYLSEVTYITNLDSPSWFNGGDSYGISLNSYNSSASNQPGGGDNANSVLNICNTKHGTSGVYGWQLAFENHQIFARKWQAGSKTSWRQFAFTDEVTSLIGNKIKWAYYRVDINSTATYSLWAGNYGFITKIRRDDVGYAVLTISYPSGANYKNTIVLATGHHTESNWDSVAYASIQPDYSSGRMLKLLIADDSSRNNGTAMILFMYIS